MWLGFGFFFSVFPSKKRGLIASSSFSFGWLLKGKVCAQSSLSKQVWISQAKRWSIDFSLKTIIQDPSNMGIDNKDPFLILLFLPPLWVVMLFLMAPTTAFIVRRTMMVWVCIYIITDVLIEIILLSSIQCICTMLTIINNSLGNVGTNSWCPLGWKVHTPPLQFYQSIIFT